MDRVTPNLGSARSKAGGKVEISVHVSPVRGERGGWGLGRVVRADMVLEALVAAGGDGESQWQGTRSTAANVGQRVGGFIAGEAHVAGDPAELRGWTGG